MWITSKIGPIMCDNLGKSYSKHESHPWIFVKIRHNLVEVGWQSKEKKSQKKKNSNDPISMIRHLILWPNP